MHQLVKWQKDEEDRRDAQPPGDIHRRFRLIAAKLGDERPPARHRNYCQRNRRQRGDIEPQQTAALGQNIVQRFLIVSRKLADWFHVTARLGASGTAPNG
jgi:hypothetical protein